MTTLSRKVRRVVPRQGMPYRARDLVVILTPAHGEGSQALVEIREKGRRRGFAAPLSAVYVMLAQRQAAADRAAKAAAKRARRAER